MAEPTNILVEFLTHYTTDSEAQIMIVNDMLRRHPQMNVAELGMFLNSDVIEYLQAKGISFAKCAWI